MSKRANPTTAKSPAGPPTQRARTEESFDIDDIFADAEADVDEEIRGKGGRRKVLTMGESLTEYGGQQESARYELFMDTQLPNVASARERLSRAASDPLSLEWSKREETVTEAPVEREPSWRLYDDKARNPLLFFKTDWVRNLLCDVAVYKEFERHMRMAIISWNKKREGAPFPLAVGASAGLLAEWLEKHRRIDLWRVTYLNVAASASGADDLGRLEDTTWIGRALASVTGAPVEPAHVGIAAFDFNLNAAGDYVLRLCYAFGALSAPQERRFPGAVVLQGLAKEVDFVRAFATENNTMGLFSEGRTRLVTDRREFYHLWRGVTREYASEAEEREDGTLVPGVRVVHGPTTLPLTFVGYYYFLVNPQQKSTLRPAIVSSLNPLDILRRERMTVNQTLLSLDEPF